MKYTVIGDPHAKPDNLDKINKLFDIIEDLGNPCIILGDLLDTKEVVRGKCLNTYINRMSKSKLDYVVLVGNHDWFNLNCEEHSLEPLKLLSNVIVVDKPTEVLKMVFLPFMTEFNHNFRMWSARPLFCHMDMPGFDYGNGHFSEEGLDKEVLKDFPIVISGHYHKYQKNNNIVYLGTPFSHSFGESNQQKYIGIFDSNTNKLELLDSPFPQHKTIEYDADGEMYWEDCGILNQSQDPCRVVLKGSAKGISRWNIENYPNIKWVLKEVSDNNKSNVVEETQSPEIQFKKWAKEIEKLDSATTALGLEVLKNV